MAAIACHCEERRLGHLFLDDCQKGCAFIYKVDDRKRGTRNLEVSKVLQQGHNLQLLDVIIGRCEYLQHKATSHVYIPLKSTISGGTSRMCCSMTKMC